MPAKLFEYLASALPILYIGDPVGDAARMLSEHAGCYVVEPDDAAAAAEAVKAGLRTPRHDRDVDHLSRRASASVLAALLDRMACP